MDKSGKEEFQKVIAAASIRDIYMLSSSCNCANPFVDPASVDLKLNRKYGEPRLRPDQKNSSGILFCVIEIEASGVCRKDVSQNKKITVKKGSDLFKISARYIIIYTVNNLDLDNNAVKLFGTENAFFNVYPYFREFAGNMGLRFNLPPIVLPLFKTAFQPAQKEKPGSDNSNPAKKK